MEAVPRMPMLCFELKHSPEYVEFGPTLKKYIRDNYGEDPAHYNKACTDLEQLRQTAVQVSQDFMGCSTLKKYFAQLQFLASRFPMEEGGEASIAFTWEDVYSGRDFVHQDIKFEQVCILYNIGALHSILGAMDTRQTAEGMKVSCTHFQCAAWAFEHLRDHFGCSAMSSDLSYEVMTFYISLMLAQAQECILEKSMTDSRKSSITAKVSAQIVEFYRTAMKHLDMCNTERIISSSRYKEWKKRLQLKEEYYLCITYYFMGRQSEDQQKFGERLTYFQSSNDKLQQCMKLAKGDIQDIQETLRFTNDVVGGKFQAAKKDNDFIYHEKLPPIDSLPEVKGASLVKGIPFNPADLEVSGPDIFQKLVPMEAHEASSVYSEEKAKLLRKVDCEVAEKNQELSHFMSLLQLDPAKLNPEPERLPQPLLEKCAAMSVRSNAIKELIDSMSAVSGVATEVDIAIRDIYQLLNDDAEREAEHQKVFGKQSPLVILSEIKKECEMYDDAHKKGNELNAELHKAMSTHIANLKLLIKPPDEIQKALPSLDSVKDPENEAVRQELLKLLSKVDEMKNQRASLEDQLRKQIHEDDITNVIVTAQDNKNKDAIFHDQLKKHDTIIGYLHQNLLAQDNILRAITDANARFAGARKTHSDHSVKRDAMIQSLINSYNVYEDLLTKSQRGLEYYQKLETNVSRLLQRCSSVCKVQQEERDQIMKRHIAKNQPPPSRPVPGKPADMPTLPSTAQLPSVPSSGIPGFEGPKLKDYLPFMKPKTFGKESPPKSMTPPGHFSSTEIGGSLPGSHSGSPVHVVNPAGCLPQTHHHLKDPRDQTSPSRAQHQQPNQTLPSQSSGQLPVQQSHTSYSAHGDHVDSHMGITASPAPPSGYNLPQTGQSAQSSSTPASHSLPASYAASQSQVLQGPQYPQMYVQQNTNTVSTIDTPVVTPSKTTDREEYGPHSHMTAGYPVHQYSPQVPDIQPNDRTQQGQFPQTQAPVDIIHSSSTHHLPQATRMGIDETNKSGLRHSQPMPLPGSQKIPYDEISQQVTIQQHYVPSSGNLQYPSADVNPPQPVSYSQIPSNQYNVSPQHQSHGQTMHQPPSSMQQQLNPTSMQPGPRDHSSQQIPPTGLQQSFQQHTLPGLQTSQSYQSHTSSQEQNLPSGTLHPASQVSMQTPSHAYQVPNPQGSQNPASQQAMGQIPPADQPSSTLQSQINYSEAYSSNSGKHKSVGPQGLVYQQPSNLQHGHQAYAAAQQPNPHASGVYQQVPHTIAQSMGHSSGPTQQPIYTTQQQSTVPSVGHQQSTYSSIQQPVSQQTPYSVSSSNYYNNSVSASSVAYNAYTTATGSVASVSTGMYVGGIHSSNTMVNPQQPPAGQPVQHTAPHGQQQGYVNQNNYNKFQAPTSQQGALSYQQQTQGYGQSQIAGNNFQAPTSQQGTHSAPYQQQTQGYGQGHGSSSIQPGQKQIVPRPPDVTLRAQNIAPTNIPHQITDTGQTQMKYVQQPVNQTPQHSQTSCQPSNSSQVSQAHAANQQTQYSTTTQIHPSGQMQPRYQQPQTTPVNRGQSSYQAMPVGHLQQVQGQNIHQPVQGQQQITCPSRPQIIPAQPGYAPGQPTQTGNYQPGYQQPTQAVPQHIQANIPSVFRSQPTVHHSQPTQQTTNIYNQQQSLPSALQGGAILQPQKDTRCQPELMHQFSTSSLDEILSSSPNSKEKTIEQDNVLTPKVLTAQEIQQQKEEALQKGTLKTSLKDPFSDPRVIDKLKAEAEEFAKSVAGLTDSDPGTHHTVMDGIWKNLMDQQEKEGKKRSMAIARCYPMKNREPDIMPYDDTRVLLTGNKDDYINANWIIDLCASCPKFIATQSPLPVTLIDFWSMVYEQGSEVVVHLTSDIEIGKKFPIYWPTEKGQTVHHGHLSLNLQSFKDKTIWIERILYVTNNETKQGRTIVHLQFMNWPISGFPEKVDYILDFIKEVHNFYKQQRSLLKPVIVHCSNGIGRTGMFLLSYIGIQELEHGNGLIDIPQLTKHMLERRKQIIRDSDQLKYCYEVLLCYAESILLRRGIVIQNPWRRKQNQSQEKQKVTLKHSSEDDILFGSSKIDNLQSTISKLGLRENSPQADSRMSSANTEQDVQLATLPDVVQQPNKTVVTSRPSSAIGSPQIRSRSGSNTSQRSSSSMGDVNQVKNMPSSLAELQNPQTFSLGSAETTKKKISKSDFGSKTNVSEQGDPNDPLNSLDPMWSIKK